MFISRDPIEFGNHAAVPFPVSRLDSARVVWLNERWCISAGINPFDDIERSEFVSLLVRKFCVQSLSTSEQSAPQLWADRYGGTSGNFHGGSGRCGSVDGFIAKGIGRTPLASSNVDPYHSNGLMWLADAIKEAICAEVAIRELPWGAVPVVAIIDGGFMHPSQDGRTIRRGGILIRPAFVRPAHFERSIFFGSSGHCESDQFRDALRVKAAVEAFANTEGQHPAVDTMFRRFAEQVGTSCAKRLWHGRFMTSNMAVDGELVDFGGFRAMPDWRMAVGLAGECFGSEPHQLRRAFLSVASSFAKYSPGGIGGMDIRHFSQNLGRIERAAFAKTCIAAFGIGHQDSAGAQEVVGLVDGLFKFQQSIRSVMFDPFEESSLRFFRNKSADIVEQIAVRCAQIDPTSLKRVKKFFDMRNTLGYDAMDEFCLDMEDAFVATGVEADNELYKTINQRIESSTCWSTLAPPGLEAIAASADTHSAIVLCGNSRTNSHEYWVTCSVFEDGAFIGGKQFDISEISTPIQRWGHFASFRAAADKNWGSLTVGEQHLERSLSAL